MTLVPKVMDELLTFREIVAEHAQKGDVFSMGRGHDQLGDQRHGEGSPTGRDAMLADHDTMASTIFYVYYLLSKHPATLQRVCAEHDSVLSRDLSSTASLTVEKPHLLSQLPYIIAVM